MQAAEKTVQHLDPITTKAFLEKLPQHIRESLLARAAEIDYPVEAVWNRRSLPH